MPCERCARQHGTTRRNTKEGTAHGRVRAYVCALAMRVLACAYGFGIPPATHFAKSTSWAPIRPAWWGRHACTCRSCLRLIGTASVPTLGGREGRRGGRGRGTHHRGARKAVETSPALVRHRVRPVAVVGRRNRSVVPVSAHHTGCDGRAKLASALDARGQPLARTCPAASARVQCRPPWPRATWWCRRRRRRTCAAEGKRAGRSSVWGHSAKRAHSEVCTQAGRQVGGGRT